MCSMIESAGRELGGLEMCGKCAKAKTCEYITRSELKQKMLVTKENFGLTILEAFRTI